MRDPATDPAVRRRMAMARYARSHNKAQAARYFGCCWETIQTAVQRVEEYERTGDVRSIAEQTPRQVGSDSSRYRGSRGGDLP